MKILVGLGNPGKKYEGTRHNVGFELLAELARRHSASKRKFDADIAEALVGAERVLLVAPQTYMNASGRSVRQALDFFQLPAGELLVACDDINLPLGKIRLRASGSSGGQKGLENLIQHLGTQNFARLRIGVNQPPEGMDSADYVLERFHKSEIAAIDEAICNAANAAETWVGEGIGPAMNKFNAGPGEAKSEDSTS
jgi:PTH1 family peptidyl-tRNA hydrolase